MEDRMTVKSAGASIAAGLEKVRTLVLSINQSHDDAEFSYATDQLRTELAAIPQHEQASVISLAVGPDQTTALLQRMAL